jgi:hypothetical protein
MVSTPFFSPTYTCMHSQAWDASHAMGAQFGTHLIGGFKVLRTYDRASGLRWRHRSCFRKRERELDGVFPNVNMKCGPGFVDDLPIKGLGARQPAVVFPGWCCAASRQ